MFNERETTQENNLIHGVAIVAVSSEGKLVVHHRDYKTIYSPGRWALVTGALEHGELIEDCAQREFRDETGRPLDGLKFLTAEILRSGVVYVFYGIINSDTVDCTEGLEMRLVTLDEFHKLDIIPLHKIFIKMAIEKLNGHLKQK